VFEVIDSTEESGRAGWRADVDKCCKKYKRADAGQVG
jgi:hypothetical protein